MVYVWIILVVLIGSASMVLWGFCEHFFDEKYGAGKFKTFAPSLIVLLLGMLFVIAAVMFGYQSFQCDPYYKLGYSQAFTWLGCIGIVLMGLGYLFLIGVFDMDRKRKATLDLARSLTQVTPGIVGQNTVEAPRLVTWDKLSGDVQSIYLARVTPIILDVDEQELEIDRYRFAEDGSRCLHRDEVPLTGVKGIITLLYMLIAYVALPLLGLVFFISLFMNGYDISKAAWFTSKMIVFGIVANAMIVLLPALGFLLWKVLHLHKLLEFLIEPRKFFIPKEAAESHAKWPAILTKLAGDSPQNGRQFAFNLAGSSRQNGRLRTPLKSAA